MNAAVGCFGLFFYPIGYLFAHPSLAFFPAAVFLLYYVARRPAAAAWDASGLVRWSLFAGLAWAALPIYEKAAEGWFQGTLNPIRVDLALVLPVLFLLTVAALAGGVTFERSPSRRLEPVMPEPFKPIRPGPYALRRNRPFVIGLAIVLVSNSLLSFGILGAGGLLGLPVLVALAVFLVRGYPWARWCLVLWFTYGTIRHGVLWMFLSAGDQRLDAGLRMVQLGSLLLSVLLLACLLFSRRLREHLDVHSFPGSASVARR